MLKKISKNLIIVTSLFLTFFCFYPVQARLLDLGGGHLSGPCDVESDYYFHIEDYQPYPYQDDTLSILGCVNRPTGNLCPLYEGYSLDEIYSYYVIPEGLNNGSQTSENMWCPLYEWQDEYNVFQNNVTNTGLGVFEIVTKCVNYNYDIGDSKTCYISAGTVEILSSEDSPEYTPPAGPVPENGVCGSDANTYFYYNDPPTNLCSTGTSDNFTFNGLAYRTGSNWSWDCLGENGGSNASCVSYLDPNSKIDGVCGDYADQDFQTVEDFNGFSPYNTYHKCSEGLYNSTSFVASVNTVTWYCTGINYGESAFCSANLITPTTDAFDYSDFEVPDFYEDITNKGWFVEAMAWLFLPTSETLKGTYDISHEFRLKAPHGYLSKFHDFFMSIVSESPEPIPFPDLVVTPFAGAEPVTIFNYVSFVEIVGADNFSRFYHFLELLIGAVVIGYLVKRGIRFIKELK